MALAAAGHVVGIAIAIEVDEDAVEPGLRNDLRRGEGAAGAPAQKLGAAAGDYEVADFKIKEGAHLAESEAPFGVINIGYTPVTSYAYPGGLRLAVINPQ